MKSSPLTASQLAEIRSRVDCTGYRVENFRAYASVALGKSLSVDGHVRAICRARQTGDRWAIAQTIAEAA